MSDLKLIALDPEDLGVISAHLQDAVLRVADITFLPRERRFAAIANRFDWAKALSPASKSENLKSERRRTGLRFEKVKGAQIQGLDPNDKRAVLSLLAITFAPQADGEGPEGYVTLTFSGGAAIRLTVECVEAELKDLGAAWAAQSTPDHPEE